MINKISNWVFGSFFRTIGRLLCFILLGFIIATILSKEDIKWTDLIGFETVNASSITDFRILGSNSIFNTSYQEYKFSSNNGESVVYHDYNFNYNFTITSTTQTHAVFSYTSYMYHWDEGQLSSGSGSIYDNEMGQFQPRVSLYSTSGSETICEMANGFIVCPVGYNQTYNKIRVQLMLHESQSFPASYTNIYISIFNLEYNVISSIDWLETGIVYYMQQLRDAINNNFNNAINNQTDIIQQQHNETISYFSNENTTQAESSANNFFSGFTTQDNGGISSIITAPLNAISGLVNSTCSPIVLPIPYLGNETLTLPCMSSIYTQHFGSFFTIYQTIIFGAVAYRMLVSIFMIIEGLKNPDDDKIEVVDL